MSVMREIDSLDRLLKLGRGNIEISLMPDGKVRVAWMGSPNCFLLGDSIEDCLFYRYFQNEIQGQPR